MVEGRVLNDITFCLMTSGELTEGECLAAIAPWRDQIVFQEVRGVFPQVKALNQMVEQCRTPYLVPLDADMILRPDTYQRVRMAVDKYAYHDDWHSILFPLWDTLTERRILALKVLRTKVVQDIPFEESATPDVNHYKRLTDAGYRCIDRYLDREVIGDHVVRGRHFCYHKYRDLYQTLRSHGWEWDGGAFLGGRTLEEKAKNHYDFFLTKYILTLNKDYIYCIAGMVDGIMSPIEHKSKSLAPGKFRVPAKLAIDEFVTWYKGRQESFLMF